MRLQSVRNDLRGTDFAELMRLVGRYVDVHFAEDDRGVEFGHVCEVEAPPRMYACRDAALPEEYGQVDALALGAASPGLFSPESRAGAPWTTSLHARVCENAALVGESVQADACAPGVAAPEPPAPASRAGAPRAPQAAMPAPETAQRGAGFLPTVRPPATRVPQRKAAPSATCAPRELDDLLRHLDAGFTQTLLRLIDERGFSDSQVYKRANISRQLFSKIRKDESYRPTKQTAIALGVALELELDELAMLLERAGFALTHSSKADVIVEYFVTNGCYDVQVINRVLYEFDQPLLGSTAA